jgi:hypothetical protein
VTPTEFVVKYRPYADTVSAGTGIDPFVLLAQWGIETGWGNQIYNANNLGNIRDAPGSFAQLTTLDAFCQLAIATWHNGYYGGVLGVVGQEAQCIAIGNSPWDAGHYDNGGGAGSSLLAALTLIGGDMTPNEHDMLLVGAFRDLQFYTGTVDPNMTATLSDGKTLVTSLIDFTTPTMPRIKKQLDTIQAAGILDTAAVEASIAQLETNIKTLGGGTVDPTIAASLDALKKHLGVGTP